MHLYNAHGHKLRLSLAPGAMQFVTALGIIMLDDGGHFNFALTNTNSPLDSSA